MVNQSISVPDPAPPLALERVEVLYFALTPWQRVTVEAALTSTGRRDRADALVALAETYCGD